MHYNLWYLDEKHWFYVVDEKVTGSWLSSDLSAIKLGISAFW